jgi:hypothetical protein
VNDVVCLVMTPFVLQMARQLGLPPTPYLFAVATASNIGSVATITGNPQNMLIGSLSGISYHDFIAHLLHGHEVWLGALVIEESWQPGVLRHGRGCGIRLQLAGKLFLQALDRVAIETCDAPENVHVIRRGMKDIAGAWQVSTRLHTGKNRRTITVGVEEDVSHRADCVTGPGAAARGDGVYADEDVVFAGVHRPQPS